MNLNFSVGDKIYILSDYTFEPAVVVSARGPKNLVVEVEMLAHDCTLAPYRMRVAREKCVWPHERIAIIWETWKGVNGRGGYRVERSMYDSERRPAHTWENEKSWNFVKEDVKP